MSIQTLLRFAVMAVFLASGSAIAAKPSDAEAISHIDNRGKEGFREFLAAGKHRAFAITPGGAWSWKGDELTSDSAVEQAIQGCQQGTEQPCVPYVLDDKVVFSHVGSIEGWSQYLPFLQDAVAKSGK